MLKILFPAFLAQNYQNLLFAHDSKHLSSASWACAGHRATRHAAFSLHFHLLRVFHFFFSLAFYAITYHWFICHSKNSLKISPVYNFYLIIAQNLKTWNLKHKAIFTTNSYRPAKLNHPPLISTNTTTQLPKDKPAKNLFYEQNQYDFLSARVP